MTYCPPTLKSWNSFVLILTFLGYRQAVENLLRVLCKGSRNDYVLKNKDKLAPLVTWCSTFKMFDNFPGPACYQMPKQPTIRNRTKVSRIVLEILGEGKIIGIRVDFDDYACKSTHQGYSDEMKQVLEKELTYQVLSLQGIDTISRVGILPHYRNGLKGFEVIDG